MSTVVEFSPDQLIAAHQNIEEKEFWISKLSGWPGKSAFPFKKVFHGERSEYESVRRIFPGKLSRALDKASGESVLKRYIILATGIVALLYKMTQQKDIVLGMPIFKQSQSGNFLNTNLVLRAQFDPRENFRNLLSTIRKEVGEAITYRNYPISFLCQSMGIPQDHGNPLFDIVVMMQQLHDGSCLEELEHNLTFAFKQENLLEVEVRYNSLIYDAEAVERILDYYTRLMEQAVEDFAIVVKEIDILSETEREQLMTTFNNTETSFQREQMVHDVFIEQVELRPNNSSVVGDSIRLNSEWEAHLTYSQLNEMSDLLSQHLRTLGARSGNLVAVLTRPCIERIVSILGILKAGCAYVPIDMNYPSGRIEYVIRDSNAGFIIAEMDLLPNSLEGCRIITPQILQYPVGERAGSETAPRQPQGHAGDAAYVIYTSGSTGNPKGTLIEHVPLHNLCHWHIKTYSVTNRDHATHLSGFGFDASVYEIFSHLLAGSVLFVVNNELKSDLHRLNEFFESRWISIAFLPTQLCEQFLKISNCSLRLLSTGGDKFNTYSHQDYQLINCYGPTENTVVTTIYRITQELDNIPIGKPIDNVRCYVLNRNFQLLPIGVIGELYIGGIGLARGYLNRPELTADRFIRDSFKKEERLYCTGDLACTMPNGNILFQGRIDHQVKIRGFRIELGEIEFRLRSHPLVKDAIVTAPLCNQGEPNTQERYLVAYIIAEEALSGPIEDIRLKKDITAYLKSCLPEYMVPGHIIKLEAFPLNASGKINRKALSVPELKSQNVYCPPRNLMEDKLTSLWAEVLQRKATEISIDDGFFDIGGHSLKATILISRLHKAVGVQLRLKDMFKYPTIRQLGKLVQQLSVSSHYAIKPVEEKEYHLLSSAQKRLYIIQQMNPEGTIYNIPQTIYLGEDADKQHLEETFILLIQRHQSLRTSFRLVDENPVQVIHPTVPFKIVTPVDSTLIEPDEFIDSFIRPFDLSEAPLIKVGILKLNNNGHLLVIDIHHIISDGVSQKILEKDFIALFNGNPLPRLRIQYKDYSAWQNSLYNQERILEQKTYWLNTFKEEPTILNLPTDYPRSTFQSFTGNALELSLGSDITRNLRQLARQERITMFMLLMAVSNILIARLGNCGNPILGTPVAGRRHADLEPVMGMFVNTLAIPTDISGRLPFKLFLAKVRENVLNALENQEYPFEDLVDEVVKKRDFSRNPIFDVMYTFQPFDKEEESPEGQTALISENSSDHVVRHLKGNRIAKFDLNIHLMESENNLELGIEYCSDLFKPETSERFCYYFKNLVASILAAPESDISMLEMLSPQEREQLLEGFNSTDAQYPAGRTIHGLFEDRVAAASDRVAVIEDNFNKTGMGYITYGQLNTLSSSLAKKLQDAGVGPDSIVALMTEPSLELAIAIFAIMKAGGAYFPLDPVYPADRLAFMLADSDARILLTDRGISIPFKHRIIHLQDLDFPSCDNEADDFLYEKPVGNAHTTYVIYTSGSTGQPKGVAVEHRNIINSLCWRRGEYNLTPHDRSLQLFSFSFDGFVAGFFTPLLSGSQLILPPHEYIKAPERIRELIINLGVTYFISVPSLYSALLELFSASETKTIRMVTLAGEAVTPALIKKSRQKHPHIELINEYGATENSVVATIARNIGESPVVSVGSPIANTKIYVLDRHLYLLPRGVAGEICIAGKGLARGYLNRPQLTAEKFIYCTTVSNDTPVRCYRTGDLGRHLPEGNIEFLGRIDQQIKIRGFRIELGEIENQLMLLPIIKEAAVIMREDTPGQKFLCAYVTLSYDNIEENYEDRKSRFDTQPLIQQLENKLPAYMIPSFFVPMERLPVTPNGKIDRKALPAPNITGGSEYVAPRDETENVLVNIWADVLSMNPDEIGIDQNFFDIGGYSLAAVTMTARIHNILHVRIPLTEMIKAPTIRAIAQFVRQNGRQDGLPVDDFNNLVLLKPHRTDSLNFFLIHDGTGEVDCYIEFCNQLELPFNFWGLHADPLAGFAPEARTLNSIAEKYIDDISLLQPRGPYYLGGWSIGGAIAFEMTKIWEQRGSAIAYLALFDAPAPGESLWGEKVSFDLKSERKFLAGYFNDKTTTRKLKKARDINQLWEWTLLELERQNYSIDRLNNEMRRFGLYTRPNFRYFTLRKAIYFLNMARTLIQSHIEYVPANKINTPIQFFAAEESQLFMRSGWQHFCSKPIDYSLISGNHFSLFVQPYLEQLVDAFCKALEYTDVRQS